MTPRAEFFQKFFQGADREVEDFFLLEYFQLSYLPGRVPERKLCEV